MNLFTIVKEGSSLILAILKLKEYFSKDSEKDFFKKQGYWKPRNSKTKNSISKPYLEVILNRRTPNSIQTGNFNDSDHFDLNNVNSFSFTVKSYLGFIQFLKSQTSPIIGEKEKLITICFLMGNNMIMYNCDKSTLKISRFTFYYYSNSYRPFIF